MQVRAAGLCRRAWPCRDAPRWAGASRHYEGNGRAGDSHWLNAFFPGCDLQHERPTSSCCSGHYQSRARAIVLECTASQSRGCCTTSWTCTRGTASRSRGRCAASWTCTRGAASRSRGRCATSWTCTRGAASRSRGRCATSWTCTRGATSRSRGCCATSWTCTRGATSRSCGCCATSWTCCCRFRPSRALDTTGTFVARSAASSAIRPEYTHTAASAGA